MSSKAPLLDRTPHSVRLRALIEDLILFGKVLIETLTIEPTSEVAARLINHFRTSDLAAIIARITRGIMLAAALDQRVVRCAKQIDNPPPIRPATQVKPAAGPRTARPRDDAGLLPRMPTAEEIASSIRKRPINAVLADIAHDLGLTEYDLLFMQIFAHFERTKYSRGIIRLLRPRIEALSQSRRRRHVPPAAPATPAATPSPLPGIATGPPFAAAA